VRAGGQQLGEELDLHPLLAVDPERGAGGAAPRELAARARVARGDRVLDDREAEAEADAVERRLENSGRPNASRSAWPGSWLAVISRSVRGPSRRTPSSSPPPRSMRVKRA
jgi:hypothetical protein